VRLLIGYRAMTGRLTAVQTPAIYAGHT
jgi:hypothetical protein